MKKKEKLFIFVLYYLRFELWCALVHKYWNENEIINRQQTNIINKWIHSRRMKKRTWENNTDLNVCAFKWNTFHFLCVIIIIIADDDHHHHHRNTHSHKTVNSFVVFFLVFFFSVTIKPKKKEENGLLLLFFWARGRESNKQKKYSKRNDKPNKE